MTARDDLDRRLDAFLLDGPAELPTESYEAARDRIDHTRQRVVLGLWRFPDMNKFVPIGLGAAAVVVVLLAGGQLLRQSAPGGVGGAPTASPSPTLAPSVSAAPSAGAVYPAWYTGERLGAGALGAGSQTTRQFLPGSAYTVPAGWVNDGDTGDFYGLMPDSPANAAAFAASGSSANSMGMAFIASPYFICGAWEDHRGTAAEIAASMAATDALATSDPVDVAIGGLTGKQVDVRLDPGWTETCPGDPPTLDLGDTRARAILLDSPDGRVLVLTVSSLHSADHEAFLAEAMPIIESFQFDITP